MMLRAVLYAGSLLGRSRPGADEGQTPEELLPPRAEGGLDIHHIDTGEGTATG